MLYNLQMTILEVSNNLQEALKIAASEEAKLEKAKATLQPLEESSLKAQEEVNRLIAEFQKLSGAVPVKPGRRGVPGKRKSYNIDPAKKVEGTYKRSLTRSLNAGMPKKDAVKKAEALASALKAKLGIA
jgi:hypothetical protein